MTKPLFERFLGIALLTGMGTAVIGCDNDMSKVEVTAIKGIKPLLNKRLDEIQGMVDVNRVDITDTSPVTKRVIEIEKALCRYSETRIICFTEANGYGLDGANKTLRRNVNAIIKDTSADENADSLERRRQALLDATQALGELADPNKTVRLSAQEAIPQVTP